MLAQKSTSSVIKLKLGKKTGHPIQYVADCIDGNYSNKSEFDC